MESKSVFLHGSSINLVMICFKVASWKLNYLIRKYLDL